MIRGPITAEITHRELVAIRKLRRVNKLEAAWRRQHRLIARLREDEEQGRVQWQR